MLHLLREYAERKGKAAGVGLKPKDVRWAIVCGHDGKFLEVVELGDANLRKNPGQRFDRCPDFSFSEMKASGVTKSHFLLDTAQIVAFFGTGADKNPKLQAKHEYFVGLLREAARVLPELSRLANELDKPTTLAAIRGGLEAQKAKPTDKVTFRLGSSYPVDSDRWHGWWLQFRESLAEKTGQRKRGKGRETFVTPSFMSGELIEPCPVHPKKIERLGDVGGKSTGDALCSFKQNSFCSYGFSQSLNAAISEEEASTYADALNDLLRNHATRLAGAKVVHWFKERVPPEDDPLPWLQVGAGEEQESLAQRRAHELLNAIREGKRPDLHTNFYYALTLSGAAGRVMVRDWMEGQFEKLVENIDAWFQDLTVVHRAGGGLAPAPKFMAVLGATVRELNDLAAPFVVKMWRVAVCQEQIPGSALAQVLARARVDIIEDKSPNHARMGLIKAYHVRQERSKGEPSMTQPYLNEDHPQPAYHCGRLMAVLAALQRRALGDVGAGVVQRYYAAASSTPALVLGRLIRTGQFHLGKLEPGLAHWYEDKLAGICCRIKDGAPRTLDLEEQSLFALGYYQQLADLRTKKSDSSTGKTEESHV